ncbi:MAG TPA: galactokinase [Bryobacteraceae bacterium]|nr:galactokinase [Bryobacteraceae bacterium]
MDTVTAAFEAAYGSAPTLLIYRAQGRVDLIGEHTDYNEGFVLPIAIGLSCYAATAPASGTRLTIRSENVGETASWDVSELATLQPRQHWTDYPIGVAQQLLRLGIEIKPANIAINSTVPTGSGLSSSAAIEVSSALAFLDGRTIEKKELALLAQRAEREFAGVPVGIMDQYVSVFGEQDHAIQIDCRSITHKAAPLPRGIAIVAVNSMVKHELGSSAYSQRVRECGEAVGAVQRAYPDVKSLRDVSSVDIERLAASMSETVHRRARHVTSENERVTEFVAVAARADLHSMGRLFLASHRSLQRDYEVSCPELDFLVETAADFSGVFGARMTGGGFGGCTVNILSPDRVPQFEQHIQEAYRRRFDIVPQVYRFSPAAGASEVA